MLQTLLGAFTLICIFLVVYHHLFYPLVLRLYAREDRPTPEVSPRHYGGGEDDAQLPSVTVVVPAYNEESWISAKIHNLAILDYPINKLRVILACDGCSDRTAELARQCHQLPQCSHLQLEIRDYSDNRGKVARINQVLEDVDSDLVALSDVSALVSVDALLVAATQLRERNVGVVNSHYRLLEPGSDGEANYWNYQSRIKSREAAFGSTLGAHGAFYLFRRELFQQLDPDTINDDFVLPMSIVAQGYRAEHDTRIVALELEKSDETMDRKRRIRISAGNLQQLLRLKHLLLPKYKGVAFLFASGKGLRVFMPFLMIASLLGSILLSGTSPIFLLLALGQTLLYLLAALELLIQPAKSHRLMKTLAYLVGGHLSGLIGTLRYAFGHERKPWKRVSETHS